jgi:carbon storage regulator
VTLDHLRFVVRFQALQLQFHVLGGWYDQLAGDGLAEPVVFSEDDVVQALSAAPAGTRVEARGRDICHLQTERDKWYCNWDGLRHASLPRRIDFVGPAGHSRKGNRKPRQRSERDLRRLSLLKFEWSERAMLVVSRGVNDSVVIGDDIIVTVIEVRGDKVRLGITAPREASVHRREVYDAILDCDAIASRSPPEPPAPPPWRPDLSRG